MARAGRAIFFVLCFNQLSLRFLYGCKSLPIDNRGSVPTGQASRVQEAVDLKPRGPALIYVVVTNPSYTARRVSVKIVRREGDSAGLALLHSVIVR